MQRRDQSGGRWTADSGLNQSDLREHEVLGAAAVQAQDEADGLEELLDARSELLLLHPAGGSRVQDAGLDDELEQVL